MEIAGCDAFAKDPLVALVAVSSAKPIEGVEQPCESKRNTICMSLWIGYELNVKKVLSGTESKAIITAAAIQHGMFAFNDGEVIMVLLDPIDDHKKQELLKAEYAVKEFIRPSYCLSKPLSQYGLTGSAVDNAHCYNTSSITNEDK